MYTAVLLICVLVSPYNCFQIKDDLGPYTTVEQCVTRATEIKDNWARPLHFPMGFKCISLGEGV